MGSAGAPTPTREARVPQNTDVSSFGESWVFPLRLPFPPGGLIIAR